MRNCEHKWAEGRKVPMLRWAVREVKETDPIPPVTKRGSIDAVEVCRELATALEACELNEANECVKKLTELLENCDTEVDAVCGLDHYRIVDLFLSVLQKSNDANFCIPILYCISKLVPIVPNLEETFSSVDWLNVFLSILESDFPNDCALLVMSILYTLTFDCVLEIQQRILLIISIEKLWQFASMSHDHDFLIRVFLCLKNLSRNPLDIENSHSLLKCLVSFRKLQNSSLKLSNVIEKYSMWILYFMLLNDSLDYQLFCDLNLVSLVSHQLESPPVEAQLRSCYVIGLLCDKFSCDFPFNIDSLLRMMFDYGSYEFRLAAATALKSMIRIKHDLTEIFLNPVPFKRIVKRLPDEDIRMKDILISILRFCAECNSLRVVELLTNFDLLPQFFETITYMFCADDENMTEDILVILLNVVQSMLSMPTFTETLQKISFPLYTSLREIECSESAGLMRDQLYSMLQPTLAI